jgi:GNAT superfamily N-acetyltransferase
VVSGLRFEEATEADIPELTAAMTRAFDDDAQRHLGQERGGPPGYDDGTFFRRWLFGSQESVGYKIVAQGRVIGGIILWIFDHGENSLGTIFVDPAYQDRGVATRAWEFIQATYPDAKSWTLQTPAYAVKNHHVYETKWGFTKVGEGEFEGPGGKVFIYKKEMTGRGAGHRIEEPEGNSLGVRPSRTHLEHSV